LKIKRSDNFEKEKPDQANKANYPVYLSLLPLLKDVSSQIISFINHSSPFLNAGGEDKSPINQKIRH